jgi:hypothetical protein
MTNTAKEHDAYKILYQSVSDNDNLHNIHFGTTKTELDEILKNNSNEPLVFSSPFSKDTKPISFYYPYEKILDGKAISSKKLNGIEVKDDELGLEFEINNKSHLLTGISIVNELPKVVARKGYKVAWCRNVGSNICSYGTFTHSNVVIHSFDSKTSDILLTHPQRGEDIDSINIDIGNTIELQTFSDVLPQKHVIFIPSHPFNSNDSSDFFPLYFCAHQDSIKVSYIFKKDPQSLLIIAEEKDDGTLNIISPEEGKSYADFYIGAKKIPEFKFPTILCHYAFMNPVEVESNWTSYKNNKNNKNNVAFYVNQPIIVNGGNPIKNGQTKIEKINTTHNVTSISWMGEQSKSNKRHIYSNYTTNPTSNFLSSHSPIINTTIHTGEVTVLDSIPSVATTRMFSRFYDRKTPCLPGIHIRSFGIRNNDNTIKPGFKFKDGYINIDVQESDPLVLDKSQSQSDDEYNITARLFTRIPFGFSMFCCNEEDRKNKEKSIIDRLDQ